MIISFESKAPRLGERVFAAPDALILGEVTIGDDSSVWYGAVLRGDVHSITVGRETNLQDRCVLHVTTGAHPCQVGDRVTVGHAAVVHGCHVADDCLVGIGAIILDGVTVEEGCVIAAGSLLPPGRSYPAGSLIVGSPAQVKREVTADERAWIRRSAEQYVALARRHASLPLATKL